MKRLSIAILLLLLLLLQYRLWFAEGGLLTVWHLSSAVATQKKQNEQLTERNHALEGEVRDLKHGLAAIEERARTELGMVKKDETFFEVIGTPKNSSHTPLPSSANISPQTPQPAAPTAAGK